MPESRDRLVRPVDVAAFYARRRNGPLGILQDEPETSSILFGSPPSRVPDMTPRGEASAAGRGGFGFGTPRGGTTTPRGGTGRGRGAYRFSPVTRRPIGRENTAIGRSRRGRSVLPSWYPRTPLGDITAVVRAIERRRARLGEVEGQEMESPMPQNPRMLGSSMPLSGAQLEHDISMITPIPTFSTKRYQPSVGKVPKILLNITNQVVDGEESELLTPQKKLLNSIDKVEKVVMEELNKLKRTPTAKKAERQKKVRTLMSMR